MGEDFRQQKDDHGASYDYVRPLATIEPTAILFGVPVNASLGFSDIYGLRAAIEQPDYRNAVVLVAWEHKSIEAIARALLAAHGGDPALVPKWHKDDFDSIYVVTVSGTGNAAKRLSHTSTKVSTDSRTPVPTEGAGSRQPQCERFHARNVSGYRLLSHT